MSGIEPVLSVRNLSVVTSGSEGIVALLDGVSFDAHANEVLCIVGESGSGKSLSMMACMGMLPDTVEIVAGEILFAGRDLVTTGEAERRRVRGTGMSMVFQDPMSALNPLMRVGAQIDETLRLHRRALSRGERKAAVHELLRLVHIANPEARARSYPHELSGGMRQRIMIAMAMAHRPPLLIADEPTTALDVTVQAQILALLGEMRRDTGAAQILITHDLGVVAQVADRVVVLYSGRVVESGTVGEIFHAPSHPYTVGLLASLLRPDAGRAYAIPGQPPAAAERPSGCAFRPRCAVGANRRECASRVPPLVFLEGAQRSACLFPSEARAMPRQPAGRAA